MSSESVNFVCSYPLVDSIDKYLFCDEVIQSYQKVCRLVFLYSLVHQVPHMIGIEKGTFNFHALLVNKQSIISK